MHALSTRRWNEGNASFPPTSLQITEVRAGVGADNVVPGELTVQFNLRYSTASNQPGLKQAITGLLAGHGLSFDCDWRLAAEPFSHRPAAWSRPWRRPWAAVQGYLPPGARPAAGPPTDASSRRTEPRVELGPINRTIHQIDEHVAVHDLDVLSAIYERVLEDLLNDR